MSNEKEFFSLNTYNGVDSNGEHSISLSESNYIALEDGVYTLYYRKDIDSDLNEYILERTDTYFMYHGDKIPLWGLKDIPIESLDPDFVEQISLDIYVGAVFYCE